MASKPGSRWANTKEDEELDAKLKKEKEEKRRRKIEKARKLEEEKKQVADRAEQLRLASEENDDGGGNLDDRPSKRRKLTPDTSSAAAKKEDATAKLLRFESGGWSKSRSVENYNKLNDIEEGTYGWVARATERTTGEVVALKRLKLDAGDRSGLPVTGLREIQILQDCKHRNIVSMREVVVGDGATRLDKYVAFTARTCSMLSQCSVGANVLSQLDIPRSRIRRT